MLIIIIIIIIKTQTLTRRACIYYTLYLTF